MSPASQLKMALWRVMLGKRERWRKKTLSLLEQSELLISWQYWTGTAYKNPPVKDLFSRRFGAEGIVWVRPPPLSSSPSWWSAQDRNMKIKMAAPWFLEDWYLIPYNSRLEAVAIHFMKIFPAPLCGTEDERWLHGITDSWTWIWANFRASMIGKPGMLWSPWAAKSDMTETEDQQGVLTLTVKVNRTTTLNTWLFQL